ncbi:MAG: GNAT family N-acetyltransferase [Paludibacter sp.]|nr:GNAT family N-acetyltransferase [Paludibacter sp.]
MEEKNVLLQIKPIKYGTTAYRSEVLLRDKVLRKPLGMSLFDENLASEKYDQHIGAYIGTTLVGVLILTELNNENIKMRQVAVDEKWRNRKIGNEMVAYTEEYCRRMGYKTMVLNARKAAVAFYEKLGYRKISEEFTEIGIPHYKMIKEI